MNNLKRSILYFFTRNRKYRPKKDLKELSNCYIIIAKNKGY